MTVDNEKTLGVFKIDGKEIPLTEVDLNSANVDGTWTEIATGRVIKVEHGKTTITKVEE